MKRKIALALVVFVATSSFFLLRHITGVNAAATITVDSTADDGSGGCTLREAITSANDDVSTGGCTAGSGANDVIEFDIAGAGPHTITPTSNLPDITTQVTIDGYSETGAIVNTADFPAAMNGTLMIEIDGSSLPADSIALTLAPGSDGSTIRGLVINGVNGDGILVNSESNVFTGNYIGTNVAGLVDDGNTQHGIRLNDANNTFGGTTAASRNISSGNNFTGVIISSANATGNVVQGNYIGVGANGTTDLGNSNQGVWVLNAATATVGGSTATSGNVVSGNGAAGVELNASTGSTVAGNRIGTEFDGDAAVANGQEGIMVQGSASGNTIGGDTALERNIISGNGANGINIIDSDSNVVSANYIGTSVDGESDLGNGENGIALNAGSSASTVGGDTTDERNIISGNGNEGVRISDATSTPNTISGNYIGTDDDGASAIANAGRGIWIFSGADGITIGGDTAGERNIVSGNGSYGIHLDSDNNDVFGNIIGGNAAGSGIIPNTLDGIYNDAESGTEIGSATSGTGNVIAGNGANGINLVAGSTGISIHSNTILLNTVDGITIGTGSSTVGIQGNIIGLDPSGEIAVGNGAHGVDVNSSTAITIGGSTTADRNVISGNSDNGITATGSAVTIQGNYIGTDDDGTTDLGNGEVGIYFDNTDNSTIGGATAGQGNVISGNGTVGIFLTSASDINTIQGNIVGLTADGVTDLGNTDSGVTLSASVGNLVGGTTSTTRNIISGNDEDGIIITSNANSNVITGNYIGTSGDGETDRGNTLRGINNASGDSTVIGGTATGAGNVISGNNDDGIEISINSDDVVIRGNYIGTDDDGLSEIPNTGNGILQGGNSAIVGGTTTAARNIIAGNDGPGFGTIQAVGGGTNNTVQGNYFGLGSDGVTIIMNGTTNTAGNITLDTGGNTIGGTTTGARNVIVGPSIAGVMITSFNPAAPNSGNIVQGNYIGALPDGSTAAGSGGTASGIFIIGVIEDTQIGGTATGAGNLIRGNGAGIGVASVTSTGVNLTTVSILNNSIYENDGGPFSALGIDLFQTVDFNTFSEVGVTPNDAGDPDTVTNFYQNFPVIDSITSDGDSVTFTYDLDVNPADPDVDGYQVDFYASHAPDPTGYGEGEIHLGADTGLTGDVSNRSFTISNTDLANGTYYFSAVTTPTDTSGDGFGSSSEFSAVLAATITDSPGGGGGGGSGGAGSGTVDLADTGRNIFIVIAAGLCLVSASVIVYRRWLASSSSN